MRDTINKLAKGIVRMLKNNNFKAYTALQYVNNKLYRWHPLSPYVAEVILAYNTALNSISNSTFQEKLDYVCKNNVSCNYLRYIFEPLDIINYYDENNNAFYLFRYKNYIELNDMGYSLDKFFKLYNGLYKECRSVVFDQYGRLVLASLPKFKNYGEDDEEWSTINCKEKYMNSSSCYITDKMDGSYVQFTYDAFYGKIIGSTSKNLNPHSGDSGWRLKRAYEMLGTNYKKMIMNKQDYTFHFEFIHPDNPIVVYYPPEVKGLYLISARNKFTGREIDFLKLLDIAKYFKIDIVKYYKYDNLETILSQTSEYSSNEKEGWVVNCIDKKGKNFRFKIKTNDYVLMHKVLSKNISSNAIIQAIADGKWDDFYSKIPDAYKEYVNNIFLEIVKYRNNIYIAIEKALRIIPEKIKQDKKEYALYVAKYLPSFLHKYLFMERKGIKYDALKKQGTGYKKLQELKEENEKANMFIEAKF